MPPPGELRIPHLVASALQKPKRRRKSKRVGSLAATGFYFRRVRKPLQHRGELGCFLAHLLHVRLQRSPPLADRGIPVGGIEPRGRLPGIESPVLERGRQFASPFGGEIGRASCRERV